MKTIIFVPILDYFRSRKGVFKKFILPLAVTLIGVVISCVFNFGNGETIIGVFENFISTQINIVAILISFSVAIITILVSADNKNIQQLKDEPSDSNKYKPINGKQLSLFQVLLSGIAYNVIIEVIYLIGLIAVSLTKMVLPLVTLKYVTGVCIFMIVHILLTLLESVAQMYLTFWAKK